MNYTFKLWFKMKNIEMNNNSSYWIWSVSVVHSQHMCSVSIKISK